MWGPQRPKFWILAEDLGFGILGILDLGWILGISDFGSWGFWILGILDFGSWGFWILGPKSKIPQSKIQNPNFFGRFWGFWILDRYVANLYVAPNFGDFGSWGFWILGILDFGLWGFWILDFGPLCSKSLCEAPNAPNLGIWNFGFWGFWGFWGFGILDFGDFGFWILRFGGWKSLGAKLRTNFGFYIRVRRLCTPPRVGGFSFDLKEFNRNCPKPKIKVYPELVVSMCLLFSTFMFLCDFLESQYNKTALRQKWAVLYTQGRGHAWSYLAHRHTPREAQRRSTQLKALCEQLVQCVGGKTCLSNTLWHCDIVTFIDRFEHGWDIFAAACLCSTVKLETSHDRGSAWRLCKAFAPQQFALASAKTIACAFQTLETHFHLG